MASNDCEGITAGQDLGINGQTWDALAQLPAGELFCR